MKRYIKLLPVLMVGTVILGWVQTHRHKMHVLFKHEKALFEDVTVNGRPVLSLSLNKIEEIKDLKKTIAHISLKGISEDDTKAFYINAYNVAVIDELNRHPEIKTIENVADFYTSTRFMVAHKIVTLKSLRQYLMTEFKDPRIHFALHLGGLSAPLIPVEAFSHQKSNKQLDFITKKYVNDLTTVKVKSRSKLLLLPEFMKWNIIDFKARSPQQLLSYINKYRTKKVPANYTVAFYPYSWKVEP